MVVLVFWIVAFVYAIPSFGLSLLICYFVVQWIYKSATPLIFSAIRESLDGGRSVEIRTTSNGAIKKAFRMANADGFEIEYYPSAKLRAFSGTIDHPKYIHPILVQIHKVTGDPMITIEATMPQASKAYTDMMAGIERIKDEVKENSIKRSRNKNNEN